MSAFAQTTPVSSHISATSATSLSDNTGSGGSGGGGGRKRSNSGTRLGLGGGAQDYYETQKFSLLNSRTRSGAGPIDDSSRSATGRALSIGGISFVSVRLEPERAVLNIDGDDDDDVVVVKQEERVAIKKARTSATRTITIDDDDDDNAATTNTSSSSSRKSRPASASLISEESKRLLKEVTRMRVHNEQIRAVKEVLKSPRLQFISASSVYGGYVYTDVDGAQTKLCGVTKILEEVFYPDYDYKAAMRSAPIPRRFKLKTGLTRPWQGQRRGRLVHDQVRVLINGGEAARAAMFGNQRSENAEFFIASMAKKGLRPLTAEYPIYIESLRLASEIDTLAIGTKKAGSKVSLLELKNFSNGFTHSNGHLRNLPALAHLSNCPLHQAFLQLAFYRHVFRLQNPFVELGPAYVVQETQTYTKYYRLPKEFLRASTAIVARVSAHRMAQMLGRASASAADRMMAQLLSRS
jgi:hypothetical protein